VSIIGYIELWPNAATTPSSAGFKRVFAEAGGVAELTMTFQADMPGLLASAFSGDPASTVRVNMMFDALIHVRKNAPLCLTCPQELKSVDDVSAVVITAADPAWTNKPPAAGMVAYVCVSCWARLNGDRRAE
jgi:hypothetical protein